MRQQIRELIEHYQGILENRMWLNEVSNTDKHDDEIRTLKLIIDDLKNLLINNDDIVIIEQKRTDAVSRTYIDVGRPLKPVAPPGRFIKEGGFPKFGRDD